MEIKPPNLQEIADHLTPEDIHLLAEKATENPDLLVQAQEWLASFPDQEAAIQLLQAETSKHIMSFIEMINTEGGNLDFIKQAFSPDKTSDYDGILTVLLVLMVIGVFAFMAINGVFKFDEPIDHEKNMPYDGNIDELPRIGNNLDEE